MRTSILISLAAISAVAISGTGPGAFARDPLVIQGIGPETSAGIAYRARRTRVGYRNAQPRPRVVASNSTRGQYGGGFIEFLITGNSSPSVARTPTVERRIYRRPVAIPIQRPRYQRQAYAQPVPAFRRNLPRRVHPKYARQEVSYSTRHKRGTIVVDTPNRFLYLVLGNGRALRYGIGVGRPGFEWSGVKRITRKAEWPHWRPPAQMRKRRPDLPAFMPGGPSNPLGARALYLGSSLYRIHGTNEPNTIGTNVSSGCIRLLNKDVVDLYRRVRVGAKVVVI